MIAAQQRAIAQAGVLTTGHVTLMCQFCFEVVLDCPCDGPRCYVLPYLCATHRREVLEKFAAVHTIDAQTLNDLCP